MVHTFKYAVLMAIPDAGRGERVNVGIVVFLPERLDVRFAELAKVRALTGNDWNEYAIKVAATRLSARFSPGASAEEIIAQEPAFDPVFRVSEAAWFSIASIADYESRVKEILQALVIRPKTKIDRPKNTRINTEIARELRRTRILAGPDDTITSHKVIRDYRVEDELRADFAQQNGVLRVATTLDLRRAHVDIREASLKAIILHRAKENDGAVRRVGIYASPPNVHLNGHSFHVRLLEEYSDELYNWEDKRDRRDFMERAYLAVPNPGSLV